MPNIDFVYKMQEYAGLPRRKKSDKKATWPGRKQVWRRYGADGRMTGDLLGLEESGCDGEALLQPVMKNGRRLEASPPLEQARQRVKRGLECLPEPLRRLDTGAAYPVEIAAELKTLAAEVDHRMR